MESMKSLAIKSIVNGLAAIAVCGSYFVFGYWLASNKDAPLPNRVLYGATAGAIATIGFQVKTNIENDC